MDIIEKLQSCLRFDEPNECESFHEACTREAISEIAALRTKVEDQAVHIERLRGALRLISEKPKAYESFRTATQIVDATPAQSLAAFRAKVLEEAAEQLNDPMDRPAQQKLRRMAKEAG